MGGSGVSLLSAGNILYFDCGGGCMAVYINKNLSSYTAFYSALNTLIKNYNRTTILFSIQCFK